MNEVLILSKSYSSSYGCVLGSNIAQSPTTMAPTGRQTSSIRLLDCTLTLTCSPRSFFPVRLLLYFCLVVEILCSWRATYVYTQRSCGHTAMRELGVRFRSNRPAPQTKVPPVSTFRGQDPQPQGLSVNIPFRMSKKSMQVNIDNVGIYPSLWRR